MVFDDIFKKDGELWLIRSYRVYYSRDNGKNWVQVNKERTEYGMLQFYSIFVLGNNVFVGTSKFGILKSTDNGESWDHIRINNALIATVKEVYLSGNLLMIGVNQSIFPQTKKHLMLLGFIY